MSFSVVVLAAGQGLRMRSALPKILHPIGGIPIITRIVSTVQRLEPSQTLLVHGKNLAELQQALEKYPDLVWVHQAEPLGTGHAVHQALDKLLAQNNKSIEKVLIVCGDVPLIRAETLSQLLEATPDAGIGVLTLSVADPFGLGRIVRDAQGKILRIVEEKEATPEQKKITEINTGFFVVPKIHLQKWLPALSAHNTQQEYYLPDIVRMAQQEGISISSISPEHVWEVMGINDKKQLASVERVFQRVQAEQLMEQGVTLLDPARFDLRGTLTVGQDVVMDVNVVLEGELKLENRVRLGPNVYIKGSVIKEGAQILANSVIEGAIVGAGCTVGPFARIRPGTVLAAGAKVGNFVEIKDSHVGACSKVNHLSYVGNATIGEGVNIGAGTITCNFDGKNKHKTIIGDRVSVGSNTQLIAPITIGEGVTIGAGTTLTRDIPAHHLVHNRIQHKMVDKTAE